MPSNLRHQLDIQSTQSYYPRPTSPVVQQKTKMSLTQTYRVASTARSKLGMEAMRPDHNLRLLVGHANLLDTLMVDLQNAEREQEAWFNNTIRSSRRDDSPKHIQWIDTVAEEQDVYDEDDSSDSDSDSEEETPAYVSTPRRRSVSPPPPITISTVEVDEDEYDDEDYEDADSDSDELALERVPSRTPELTHEDSDSEDDSMPPSPPDLAIPINTKVHDFASVPFFSIEEKMVTVNTTPLVSAY